MEERKSSFHHDLLLALDSAPRPEASIEPFRRHRRSGGRRAKPTTILLPSLARSVKELKEAESPCMDLLGWGRAPQPAEPAMHGDSAAAAHVTREDGESQWQRSCRRPPVPRLKLLPTLESCSASQGSQYSQQPATDPPARATTRLPETARTRSSSEAGPSASSLLACPFLSARGPPTSGASACLMTSRHRTVGGPLVRRPLFHSVVSAAAGLKGENSNSNLGKVFWAASELLASYRDVVVGGGGRSIFKRALARQASMMLRVQVGQEGGA